MVTYAPKLAEFLAVGRAEFNYLAAHGFVEEPAMRNNPFALAFSRSPVRILVEGTSWGFGVNTLLSHGEQCAPLWAFARAKGLPDAPPVAGQLALLAQEAALLLEVAPEVLVGDATAFPLALQIVEAEVERTRMRERQADLDRTTALASEAFHAGQFGRAVELLQSRASDLSRAQGAMLKLANKRLRQR